LLQRARVRAVHNDHLCLMGGGISGREVPPSRKAAENVLPSMALIWSVHSAPAAASTPSASPVCSVATWP
jgi:hypothetical protein